MSAGNGDANAAPSVRAGRLWTFAAAVIAVLLVAETAYLVAIVIPTNWELGQDFAYYRDLGLRWLADGSYYLPRQLEGPYVITLMQDVLYPPNALLLFVPFAVLPAVLWWAVPVALTGYVIRGWRAAPWAVVVMLVLLAYPRAIGAYLFGNTDIWFVAGIAAGLRWHWPAVLVTMKPSLLPFALIGIRHRSWWVAAVVLGVVSLPMVPLYLDYLMAMRHAIGASPLDYSLGSVPLLMVPVVAWLGRSRQAERTEPRPG